MFSITRAEGFGQMFADEDIMPAAGIEFPKGPLPTTSYGRRFMPNEEIIRLLGDDAQ